MVAPTGTVAVTWVVELRSTVTAATPLKVTGTVPVPKPLPVMTTLVPTGPKAGARAVMAGTGTTVKVAPPVTPPPNPVTEILPVVAPTGTTVVIWASLSTVKSAAIPLNATPVTPVKLMPEIVTVIPSAAVAGVKPVIVGVTLTTAVPLVTLPSGLVMMT